MVHHSTTCTLKICWLLPQVLRPRKAGEKSETVRLEVKLLNGTDLLLELVCIPASHLLAHHDRSLALPRTMEGAAGQAAEP